jgi:tRNA A37 threonylcarbamoyladenosine modification protein TsaB
MSNYSLKAINTLSLFVQEKKEKRRKVLEAVRARRNEIYTQFRKKNAVAGRQ